MPSMSYSQLSKDETTVVANNTPKEIKKWYLEPLEDFINLFSNRVQIIIYKGVYIVRYTNLFEYLFSGPMCNIQWIYVDSNLHYRFEAPTLHDRHMFFKSYEDALEICLKKFPDIKMKQN